MAKAFYDKTINVMSSTATIDEEGGVNYTGLTVASNFKGNVSFSNCKQIQEEYGLDYNIDIAITTYPDTSISMGDVIQYDGVTYRVTDKLSSDSHILVVATKWRQ